MADGAKLIMIDGSVTFKRTISIKLINDTSLRLIAATNTIFEATDKIKFYKPDVIILGIDKVDATNLYLFEKFIKETGVPMVIVTNESARFLHLIREVRIEFVSRPPLGDMKLSDAAADEVFVKVKRIKNIPMVAPNPTGSIVVPAKPQSVVAKQGTGLNPNMRSVYQIQGGDIVKPQLTSSKYNNMLIAVGSSTGGTEAVYTFLTKLPQDMPPILIVQHMPPVFTKLYADRLNLNCKIEVREGANGDVLYPGLALIAPGDKQMGLTRRGGRLCVECVRTDKVSGHCPSVDFMFETVAATMGCNAIGIIMTGMGRDGAQAMLQMHKRGSYNIGQDEASSVVYGMPRAAFELGGVDIQAPPEKIPEILQKVLRDKVR